MRSHAITTTKTRLLLTAGAAAITIAALAGPATATPQMPPDDTYTIVGTPTIVRPGGTITFTGTCWMNKYLGATTDVTIIGSRVATRDESPFGFYILTLTVDPKDGSYSGRITVPADAPPDDYTLGGQCITQDQVPGVGRMLFVVAGDPLPTTTTSSPTTTSTTTPSTTTSGPATPPTPTAAPPAIARRGSASFTG